MDILAIVGIGVGIAAIVYALYQSYQGNKHAKRAEFLLEMILKALQNNGLADLNYDKKGRIIGMNLTIEVGTASLTMTAHPATVTTSDNEAE